MKQEGVESIPAGSNAEPELAVNSDEFIDVENALTDLGQPSAKAISHACHAQLYKGHDEKPPNPPTPHALEN